MASIFEHLEHQVADYPDKTLYSFLDINGAEIKSFSYRQFYDRTTVIASQLHGKYGFKKGDRVLLAYPPGIEIICALFACARIGLISVPVYPPTSHGFQASLYKITHIAKDCGAVAVLTSKEYFWSFKLNSIRTNASIFSLGKNELTKLQWIITEDFKSSAREPIPKCYSDILFLQYTSGSTNDPKGVMVTHENIIHNCGIVVDHMPIGVSWLPQYHDMGLIGYYLFFALKGGTTYGFSPMDFIQRPALWLETITKFRGSASSAPNFAYEYCLRPGKIPEKSLANLDLSSLRFLMTAAEPVKADVYRRFLKKFEPYGLQTRSFFAAYGLAEFTLAVTNYGWQVVTVEKESLLKNKLKLIPEDCAAVSPLNETVELVSCGLPLSDTVIKIVEPETSHELAEGYVGEIWLNGKSKCAGYWNKPELTREMFNAKTNNSSILSNNFLRTGDMGFMHKGELYVCGRRKDMLIIRGLNYYPQDIEKVVEDVSPAVRKGCVAAFEQNVKGEEKLVVVAEVKKGLVVPDGAAIAVAISKYIGLQTHQILFIEPRTIPKTSSGKIIRYLTKKRWLDGSLKVVNSFTNLQDAQVAQKSNDVVVSPFAELKARYGLEGNETHPLVEVLDSIDLAILIDDLKKLLNQNKATDIANEIDLRIVQRLKVSEFFDMAEHLAGPPTATIGLVRKAVLRLKKEQMDYERSLMLQDAAFNFDIKKESLKRREAKGNVLLTGGTGFFGPFLLKSLLEQTNDRIYVLIRAETEDRAKERLLEALDGTGDSSKDLLSSFVERVVPMLGDLSQQGLGLKKETLDFLSNNIDAIYHNGAVVNYLFNYEKMRDSNVMGTVELLKLAATGVEKVFNHISTTFVFGWAVKETLYETDNNEDLNLLDFGYSQSKWVSEEIVQEAKRLGIPTRIFRPALITPSVSGSGYNFDIAIRLLAFMINHGIGISTFNQVSFMPAEVAANNIVCISGQPSTMNKTFHVTRDCYANMMEITAIITQLTGREFIMYSLPKFVHEVISRCTKNDLLFPLLDFFTRSISNISAMEFKRYDSSGYQSARDTSEFGLPDPSLEETVRGMLLFMKAKGIIDVEMVSPVNINVSPLIKNVQL